jgi:hypothetical protein
LRDAEIDAFEFDLGFVVWPVQSPGGDRLPGVLGDAQAVVDRETGELTTWWRLPVPVVVDRYRAARRAGQRFPPDVYHELWSAGWREGRDVAATVGESDALAGDDGLAWGDGDGEEVAAGCRRRRRRR